VSKRRVAKWVAGGVAVFLAVAQLVPVARTNPPGGVADATAPEHVRGILRRACYDCHSNETSWPWYSHVAPVSWLVAHDVGEGREVLNYSRWQDYGARERAELLEETWEEVAEREMPPAVYVLLHPEARLDEADRSALRAWVRESMTSPED
jgi:hypothetical protein